MNTNLAQLDKYRRVLSKFQLQVLQAVAQIPPGSVSTYSQIAKQIGHPNSARAVANACAKNPLLITIPCHRVIRSDGGLGGYSGPGGIKQKRALLLAEGYNI